MMKNGRVVRFNETRGYGFVAPEDGGDDVFIHANALEGSEIALAPGVPVEFLAVDSDRGPKAVRLRVRPDGETGILEPDRAGSTSRPAKDPVVAEDDVCDVLSERTLTHTLTEALLRATPELTGAQLLEVRRQVLELARRHGWVED